MFPLLHARIPTNDTCFKLGTPVGLQSHIHIRYNTTTQREFSKTASQTSLKVIIGAAGGAAHLPGMCASWTTLPVIGLPVKASVMDGWDSLVSMTQMPRGEPVATVGINNSTNAALLAVRILGAEDKTIRERLRVWMEGNEKEVMRKDKALLEDGWETYLKGMGK